MSAIRTQNNQANDKAIPTYRIICGNALEVLRQLPEASVDTCMTSPPYWGHREYDVAGIGREATYTTYVSDLIQVLQQVRRVLKPEGSMWLNIGDSYDAKNLVGI